MDSLRMTVAGQETALFHNSPPNVLNNHHRNIHSTASTHPKTGRKRLNQTDSVEEQRIKQERNDIRSIKLLLSCLRRKAQRIPCSDEW